MTHSPLELHREQARAFTATADGHDRTSRTLSFAQLGCFVAIVAIGIAAYTQRSTALFLAVGAGVLAFAVLRGLHIRATNLRDEAAHRARVHERHVKRMSHEWDALGDGADLLPADHGYAHDIDLVGRGSLFALLDTTHTVRGAAILATWLGAPASREEIAARQAAVRELAPEVEYRRELEVAAEAAAGKERLDGRPFLAFSSRAAVVSKMPWLIGLAHVLPVLTLATYAAGELGLVPRRAFVALVIAQVFVWLGTAKHAGAAFELVAARRGFADAFARMLGLVEASKHTSPRLREIRSRIALGEASASSMMRALDRWAGLAELRNQPLLSIPANIFLLWDLHVLYRLERWNARAGRRFEELFEALGELEALASLATLAEQDPGATFPEILDTDGAMVADAIAHPLLRHDERIANDVALPGPGSLLVVTGSNMAGKSTLLRAVGLATALALAGGPVIATRMKLPVVRLRASMRATDSLQRGASYFHAELAKLRGVVADAEHEPRVFFLLDELLRGTNARARHLGARAVILHLLARDARGLVATHDTALAELEAELPGKVANAHFTDVVRSGEMTFDYTLRSGVVKTSNALRLLQLAGIDLPSGTDLEAVEGA